MDVQTECIRREASLLMREGHTDLIHIHKINSKEEGKKWREFFFLRYLVILGNKTRVVRERKRTRGNLYSIATLY